MARGWGSAAQFLGGFNAAYDTVGKVLQDYELAKIARARPEESQGFTAEQGEQLRAAADSGQYDVAFDAGKGAYTVTPKADPNQTGVIAQQGVTDFLGDRTAGTLSPSQIENARQRAMAGVLMKENPLAGARMLRETLAADRDEQAFEMNRKRFGWEQARAEREARLAGEQEAERDFSRELDDEVGKWFKARLVGADGTERSATVDDHLAASQYRAAKLAQAGRMDAAGRVLKDYAAQAAVQIQLQAAERDQALGRTAAALAAGDLNAVREFYNRYVPDGARVTDVVRDATGGIVIKRETLDGRPMPDTKLKDTGQLTAALATFKDPMALYNWSQNEFRNTLALNADRRAAAAEGRAQVTHEQARQDRRDKQAAIVGLADNDAALAGKPLSSAEREAIRTGVIQPRGNQNAAYKVESGDVATLLGSPATDRQGRPVVDPLTGRQQVNRNLEEEQRFFRWMRENNITDTNKGLALYLGQLQGGSGTSTARPTLTKGQVVGGYEFLGGDPKDRNNWKLSGGIPR